MRLAFFVLLTVLPLLEIALLVKFGQWAGVWVTLAVVIGTAVAGIGVLQRQGLTMMLRTQEAVMRGEPDWAALPSRTPATMRVFLRRCLEKDPAARYQTAHEVLEDIKGERSTAGARLTGTRTIALTLPILSSRTRSPAFECSRKQERS